MDSLIQLVLADIVRRMKTGLEMERRAARCELLAIDYPSAIKWMLAALKEEKDADVRQALVRALAKWADGPVIQALQEALTDASPAVCGAAASALRDLLGDGSAALLAELRDRVILLVDDDPWILRMVGRILSKREHRLVTAEDGERGLQLALSLHPKLIITDVMMGKMDGWTLVRTIRTRPEIAETPVIILTALGGDEERIKRKQRRQLRIGSASVMDSDGQ